MASSGTVSAYPWNQAKVIEHAFRRATGKPAERISAESVQIMQDLIFTVTSEWAASQTPLWTVQYLLLPITAGSRYVNTPNGTLEILHAYWRILNPYRGVATLSTGADGSTLFGGQPNADVTIAGANPGVMADFGAPMELDTIGVLLGGSSTLTAALEVQISQDGVTFVTAQTLPSTTFQPGVWSYFDLAPVLTAPFIAIVAPVSGAMVLNQLNFGLAQGEDIELGALNVDDQFNLPDKQFQNPRPVSFWQDRQINSPVLNTWPAPNLSAFYNGTVTALVRRYIQDPGAMTNTVEIPQKFNEALIWRLAQKAYFELPEANEDTSSQASIFALSAKQQRYASIEKEAARAEAIAWSDERIRAPIRFAPNISPYTR